MQGDAENKRLNIMSAGLDQTSTGMVVLDLNDRVIYVNRAYAGMHGVTVDEMLGRPLNCFHTRNQEGTGIETSKQITRQAGEFEGEVLHQHRSGAAFPMLMRNTLLKDLEGNAVGIVGTGFLPGNFGVSDDVIEKRKSWGRMVADIAAHAISVSDIGNFLKNCLAIMGQTLAADGLYVWEYSHRADTVSNIAEKLVPGIASQKETRQNIPAAKFSHLIPRLKKNQVVKNRVFEDLSEGMGKKIPGQLAAESVLMVPIFTRRKFFGYIGIEDYRFPRRWTDEDVTYLRTVAHLVGNSIECCRRSKALRESERSNRMLIHNAPAGIYEINLVDMKFTKVNDLMCRLTGYSKKEFLSMDAADILMPESRAVFSQRLVKMRAGKKVSETVEFRIRTKTGRTLWARFFPRIFYKNRKAVKLTVVCHDITEQVLARQAQQESETRFMTFMEYFPGIALIKDEHDRVLYTNRHLKKLSSVSKRDAETPSDILIRRQAKTAVRRDGKPLPYEFGQQKETFSDENGTEYVYRIINFSIRREKKPALLGAIGLNITQEMRAEEALQQANRNLEKRVQARTRELRKAKKKLIEKNRTLQKNRAVLEKLNFELVQTNNALSVLARNMEKMKEDNQGKLARTITSRILPIVENLQADPKIGKARDRIDLLANHLRSITADLQSKSSMIRELSNAETRVASLIKSNLTNNEIAMYLNITAETVKTHRRNIRTKLNLKGEKLNLNTYLASNWQKLAGE